MLVDKIQQIKNHFSIVELAQRFGCNPNSRGNCKNNALRAEKTSSLTVYPETNTFTDFGGVSGDVIEFYSLATGKNKADAINEMFEEMGGNTAEYTPIVRNVVVPDKEYIKPDKILKMFQTFTNLNHKEHKAILDSIAPLYLFKESHEDDYNIFFDTVRYCKTNDTAVALLHGVDGLAHTFRYRNKIVGDSLKKWVAVSGSKASYLYCNLTHQPITIVCEGSRDYLTASLCGYSVISLPSAGYSNLPNELLEGRLVVFLDDDDDKGSMLDLYNNAICDKIFFNHKEFKKITKCKSKDFSDYLYQFDNLATFKETFETFIHNSKLETNDNWKEILFKISEPLTLEDIENAQNQEFLFDEIIIKSQITTIVSPPNSGKSAFSFGVIQELLETNKIKDVFIFDPDSPLTYVKNTVEVLKEKFGDRFNYFNGIKTSVAQMTEILNAMALLGNEKGRESLILVDGLQFMIAGSANDDKNSKPFLESLKMVRDRFKATIMLLHHTKRQKSEEGHSEYLGSQLIEALTDNMIMLKADENLLSLFFKKSRSDKKGCVFTVEIDFATRKIKNVKQKDKEVKAPEIKLTGSCIDMIKQISKDKEITTIEIYSLLSNYFPKDDIKQTISDNKNILWTTKKGEGKYEVFLKLIKQEPEIVEFESDNSFFDMF